MGAGVESAYIRPTTIAHMLPWALWLIAPTVAHALSMPLTECFSGPALFMLSASRGVRISQHGMFFYDTPIVHDNSHPCPRIADGLCAHGNYSFLRCTAEPFTFVDAAPAPFHEAWLLETPCNKVLSMDQFDLTACDLSLSDTTVLWGDGRVSVRHHTAIPYGPKVIAALIMVWLVVNLGESVALLLDVEGSKPRNRITAGLCVVLVLLIGWYSPWDTWATTTERWTFAFVVFYILAYSAYHMQNQNTVNVIVGCLLLVTARYYGTCETQYVAPFIFLIATRFFQKCLVRRASVARWGFMGLDVAMFVTQYVVGFAPSFEDRLQGPLCVVGMLFCAWSLGRFVAHSSSSSFK